MIAAVFIIIIILILPRRHIQDFWTSHKVDHSSSITATTILPQENIFPRMDIKVSANDAF